MALEGAAALDSILAFADLAWAKASEWLLLILLGLHLAFGARILMIEFRPLQGPGSLRTHWIAPGLGVALLLGSLYVLLAS